MIITVYLQFRSVKKKIDRPYVFGISQLKLQLLAIRFTTGLIRPFDIKFALWFDASCDQ